MIGCLTATIDRKKWMRQVRRTQFAIPTWSEPCGEQTGLIRSTPDCVNRFMLEQNQLIFHRGVVPFPGDAFFLQRQSVSEFNSPEPVDIEGGSARCADSRKLSGQHAVPTSCCIHICMPPAIPSCAASCARTCVSAMASASAASASGVSVKPRSARTMNAT